MSKGDSNWMGLTRSDFDSQTLAQASTLSAACYLQDDLYRWEREALLPNQWQYAGHHSQIPEPGCYAPLQLQGRPVLLVNDGGKLRAFMNVCRHRAGPLATCPGQAGHLRCRYHGWVYGLDGRLRAAPRFENVEDFEPEQIRLVSLPLTEWQGLLFVSLADDPHSLDDEFAYISDRSKDLLMSNMISLHRQVYPVACNWKLYVDNFLESYHVPLVHPSFDGILDSARVQIETHGRASLQSAPVTGQDRSYGVAAGEAHYWFVFPNLMLNLVPGRLQLNWVEPLSTDSCQVHFEWFGAADANHDWLAADVEFSTRVQAEDEGICAAVQRGLASGAWRSGRLSVSQEGAVHHFHQQMRRAYRVASGADT